MFTSHPINPMRYPTLYMYMVNLPQGVESYPEAKTQGELAVRLRERFPNLGAKGDLPPDVMAAIGAPWRANEWVPEVSFMILHALIRDVVYRNDEGFLQLCYEMAKETFAGTMMRALMHFVSPSLLVMGATKRWPLLKQGTTLKAIKQEKNSLNMSLTYPKNLYHRSMLDGFAQSFKAAIDCTKAQNTSVQPNYFSPTECRYKVTWTFD